ncbi:MAG TPA: hypothetical protein VLL54_04185 [Pyrinomonadaceae bacterium]|nr:hypothetical protein [Pyrinomonadaceae bacterium]
MITGFNTDIEYDGVVYHVQTEDKGLDSPLILSLVYSGGAILASKRSRYEDLIATGFDEAVLSERLKRQHRLICAAINAGRLEDLKRMGAKSGAEAATPVEEIPEAAAPVQEVPQVEEKTDVERGPGDVTIEIIRTGEEKYSESSYPRDTAPLVLPQGVEGIELPGGEGSPFTVHDPRRQSPHEGHVQSEGGVIMALLDDAEFHAGQTYEIHVMLEDSSGLRPKALGGMPISVKILGTAFRPQIYSITTERSGVAVFSATMPSFTSGRAAVLFRAVVKTETIELRRVIHPAVVS